MLDDYNWQENDMFGIFKKRTQKRLEKKRNAVRKLIHKRGFHQNKYFNFDGIGEGLLDEIIALNYFDEVYFSAFDLSTDDLPVSSVHEDDDYSESKEDPKETAYNTAAAAIVANEFINHEPEPYSAPEPERYEPEPTPTRQSYSSYEPSDSGSSYDSGGSSDSGGSDD